LDLGIFGRLGGRNFLLGELYLRLLPLERDFGRDWGGFLNGFSQKSFFKGKGLFGDLINFGFP